MQDLLNYVIDDTQANHQKWHNTLNDKSLKRTNSRVLEAQKNLQQNSLLPEERVRFISLWNLISNSGFTNACANLPFINDWTLLQIKLNHIMRKAPVNPIINSDGFSHLNIPLNQKRLKIVSDTIAQQKASLFSQESLRILTSAA